MIVKIDVCEDLNGSTNTRSDKSRSNAFTRKGDTHLMRRARGGGGMRPTFFNAEGQRRVLWSTYILSALTKTIETADFCPAQRVIPFKGEMKMKCTTTTGPQTVGWHMWACLHQQTYSIRYGPEDWRSSGEHSSCGSP